MSHQSQDVRMRGFAGRSTVDEAYAWLAPRLRLLDAESVPLDKAAGRVLAGDVASDVDVPSFSRAMMDGYAVQARDTLGASSYNRLSLRVAGESLPGRGWSGKVTSGMAVRIMTGAPLPAGADAVLPAEYVEPEDDRILVLDSVPPAKHVGTPGEDIRSGTTVLIAGRVLRPQDVGVLSSIGTPSVEVVRRPRVSVIVTGSELLEAGATPHSNRIPDANGPMLAALVQRDGGLAVNTGIVADNPNSLLGTLQQPADLILVSGGSSVGQEDYAPVLVAEHGELGIHGVAMRPSSPVGMGVLRDVLVFLLPGNPVSCLCAYDFFAGHAIRRIGGRDGDWPYRRVRRPLARKLVSTVGRLDYARVLIQDGAVDPIAVSGASVLSSTSRANGFVIVPSDSEGYPAGAEVDVHLYD